MFKFLSYLIHTQFMNFEKAEGLFPEKDPVFTETDEQEQQPE